MPQYKQLLYVLLTGKDADEGSPIRITFWPLGSKTDEMTRHAPISAAVRS
jgi:hypothetical protein